MRTAEERKIMTLRRHQRWKRSKRELTAYGFAGVLLAIALYFLIHAPLAAPQP